MYYQTSKIFFGQVHYGHLLVPGQVENFTISTPLVKQSPNIQWLFGEHISSWKVDAMVSEVAGKLQTLSLREVMSWSQALWESLRPM